MESKLTYEIKIRKKPEEMNREEKRAFSKYHLKFAKEIKTPKSHNFKLTKETKGSLNMDISTAFFR